MHGHENRARYAKAEDEEMRLVDVEVWEVQVGHRKLMFMLTKQLETSKLRLRLQLRYQQLANKETRKLPVNKPFPALLCFMFPSACLSAALPCGNRLGAC